MLKKKISKIFIGSNNRGKLREIRELLPKRVKIYTPTHLNLSKSPIENGKTFIQNSLIKAKYYSKKSEMICLADDSGLEIDILNKRPGIFSARWSGRKKNFNIAIKKVFKELLKENSIAYKYIKARGIIDEALETFNIGFAPDHNNLLKYLELEGFGFDKIEKTDLLIKNNKGESTC